MLRTRALSSLVLAPPALAAVWVGGLAFAALVALAVAIMCWEWHTIVSKRFDLAGRVAAAGCALAALLTLVQPLLAVPLVIGAAIASTALSPGRTENAHLWAGFGALYAGVPSVALVWLETDPAWGRATILWLLLVVWATDIGAYAFGRMIGGPKLMPAVSPKKTWAGLLGGMLCAGLVGLGVALVLGLAGVAGFAVGSALLAVVAQAGDLFESWIKRRYDVKDSSNIIPGHGGVLDRVDGLLTVAVAVAIATWASGAPVLSW
ncbi:MAG: phosphatidate cytidylyltransferase [Solirubrobacterales bacterium]